MAKLVMGQLTISERQQPGRIVCKCVQLIITSRYYYDYLIQSNMGDPILIYAQWERSLESFQDEKTRRIFISEDFCLKYSLH
jgi:hypothetical protein